MYMSDVFLYLIMTVRGPYGGINMTTTVVYAGCLLLVLEHIHSHGYAYRDLKPENIVIG